VRRRGRVMAMAATTRLRPVTAGMEDIALHRPTTADRIVLRVTAEVVLRPTVVAAVDIHTAAEEVDVSAAVVAAGMRAAEAAGMQAEAADMQAVAATPAEDIANRSGRRSRR
jgi:hypothetical protein